MDKTITEHDAFGMIGVSRVSGRANLFGVDYPQDHYITLKIKRAKLQRDLSNDWYFGKGEIIEISMSEVQYARMISSPNHGDGVPCTLSRYTDPVTGEYKTPRLPDDHAARPETFAKEVRETGQRSAERLNEALADLDAILAGGAPKKGDLTKVREKLRASAQGLSSSLGFVVQQAEEAIHKSATNAMTEVDAHIDFAMTRLGERALGSRLAEALDSGHTAGSIGELILTALAPPEADHG